MYFFIHTPVTEKLTGIQRIKEDKKCQIKWRYTISVPQEERKK